MKKLIHALFILFLANTPVLFLSAFKKQKESLLLLKVSKSGRYLVKENGAPFFWLGDTGWSLFSSLSREEAFKYLKDRSDKKFTVIQAHLLGWTIDDKNAYNEQPFINKNFNTPNENYWKHVDYILETAEGLGLYMALLPAWAATYTEVKIAKDGETAVEKHLSTDTITAYRYGKFLGARYKNKKNIIWVLGGDVWGRNDGIYDNLAKGLTETYASNDPDKVLISFHPQGGTFRPPATSTSEFYHHKSWLDFNMIQSGHSRGNKNYERIAKDYKTLPDKPSLESEPCYEEHPIQHKFEKGVFKASDLRQRAYWSLLAGGFGFTYGANGIWQMDKPGKTFKETHKNFYWYDALNFAGGNQMKFVRSLMESRPFIIPERVPDQSLIISDTGDAEMRIQCARADDYSYAIVYSTSGTEFMLDVTKFKTKKMNAWWYNPRDGKLYSQKNKISTKPFDVIQNTGIVKFNPPGEPSVENDWILVIDDASKSFPLPGARLR